ncbi:MAG: SRPBCC family protein [Acidimicrobiales bacterium]
MKVRSVSATRTIQASPAVIFDLLADPRRHGDFDGSSTLQRVRRAPPRLSLGSTFAMDMKIGLRYSVTSTVVAFEEARCIAWQHFARFTWRYDLEAEGDGTRVTERFDYDQPWAFVIIILGWPERNRRAMLDTLERLDRLVTAP